MCVVPDRDPADPPPAPPPGAAPPAPTDAPPPRHPGLTPSTPEPPEPRIDTPRSDPPAPRPTTSDRTDAGLVPPSGPVPGPVRVRRAAPVRRRTDGSVLPDITSDERDVGWGELPDRDDDERLLREVPPHHGG